jgi:hypothetical protein
MQQVLNSVGQLAQQLASVIWQVLQFIWNWSFGQVARMLAMPFGSLPIWKQVLYVIVIAALVYFFFKIGRDLLNAVMGVLKSIMGLINALISMLPQVVVAGLIAFGGAWVIAQSVPMLDNLFR